MSTQLRFDGKVAIVTGAGGGLGRSHALLLASRGAKVVVNDLGGSFKGEGKSSSAADKVVDEIRSAGGEAVANYDSVENGDAIVKTAVDAFGRIDILINNAGILRDTSFQNMKQEDWDLIYRVHVFGSYKCTAAAWPIMREQGYGRVVMTASAAGIYGNFGQANYSMAKLGLHGLAQTLAIEGRKRGIMVNTIAPIAGSRMTETVLPAELIAALRPEYVSPLVAWLCHDSCEDTGGLYEVGGGFMGKLRWERAVGKTFRLGRAFSAEDVRDAWSAISGFERADHPGSIAEAMQPIMQNVEKGPSRGGNQYIDVDEALGFQFPEVTSKYDERDVALYALGVGAARNPTDAHDLQLVYEMYGGGFKVLPTFGVIPALRAMMDLAKQGKQAPGLKYGLDRLLHGEQYLELTRPLPTSGTLSHRAKVKDIFDKGKNALVVNEVITYDQDGNQLARNEFTSVIRGAGGWGGDRGPSAEVNVAPDRAPDAVVEDVIPANQALLYRLTGDWNPLHADPDFAKAFGFDKPILHGLCTFGYAARNVLARFAPGGDPDFFKSIKVRFADSVFPGETLVTEMWKEGDRRIVFRAKVKERNAVVISNAAIELFAEVPKPVAKKPAAAASAGGAPAEPISRDIFQAIGAYVKQNPELAAKVKTVFQFKLSAPASVWTVDLDGGTGSVSEGASKAPKCTLELSDGDFMAMCTGKADAMKLFTSGKLKISGDIMASQKLEFLRKLPPELVLEQMKARGAGGGAVAAGPAAEAAASGPTSWDVFIALADHVERNPDLVGKVGSVYLFRLKNPDSAWTLDLKNGPGKVDEGETTKPDCTLEIAEADFIDMTTGKANPMKLFTTGKLKISGNVMASQKLEFLQKVDPQRAMEVVAKARAEGRGPGPSTGSGRTGSGAAPAKAASAAQAPAIIAALEKRLAATPNLADEVNATIRLVVGDSAWLLDLASRPPKVTAGAGNDARTTMTISDADLVALVRGEKSARDLHQHGALRVDGDVTVAHRLGFLKGLI